MDKDKKHIQDPLVSKEELENKDNLLIVKDLKKYFPIKKSIVSGKTSYVKAVDGVSFTIKRGTTMGLVGESGCGKSTTGRTLLRLQEKTSGEVYINGQEIFSLNKEELRKIRPTIQIVFQDPFSSLSPRLPVGEIIGEGVREHGIVPPEEFDDYITRIMEACGLQEYHKDRYPHEFSGGQRQRICIARALALNPDFIVCDEPVSALDVSIQAQIINLLRNLQKEFDLTYLFISHDLSVVEHISDTVGVMYLGNMVEYSETEKIFNHPLHPYTKALFSAIPIPDPDAKMERIVLEGSIPSPANPPAGCKFHTRCKDCMEMCKCIEPRYREVEDGHFVACHLYNTPEMNASFEKEMNEAKKEENGKNKKKPSFIDDGRTIADMNVEGMPWYSGEKNKTENKRENDFTDLTFKEKRAMMRGILGAALLIAALFLLVFFLFILFCSYVWLK